MDRGIPVGNKLCARYEDMRRQQLHRDRIVNMKSTIDTSQPRVLALQHLVTNMKREQLLEERYSEIDRENRILLNKMSDIMAKPGVSTPRGAPAGTPRTPRDVSGRPPSGPVSLNRDFRKKELLRITKENQNILKRIQQAQPVYNHVESEGSYRKHQAYVKNCAEYPVCLGTPRKTPRSMGASSELVQLAPELSEMEAEESLDAYRRKPVLKEEQMIGNRYYQVEMASDGVQLYISAHDPSTQASMELILKEKAHRKLYREVKGDYSQLAKRLALADGGQRLVILDAPGRMPPPAPGQQNKNLSPQAGIDADDMVKYSRLGSARSESTGANSMYAEVVADEHGDPKVSFRGLSSTPGDGGAAGASR